MSNKEKWQETIVPSCSCIKLLVRKLLSLRGLDQNALFYQVWLTMSSPILYLGKMKDNGGIEDEIK